MVESPSSVRAFSPAGRPAPRTAVAALILLSWVFLGACGGHPSTGDPPDPPPAGNVSQIVVSPTSHALAVGEQIQLFAIASDPAGRVVFVPGFTWSVSNPAVASVNALGVVVGVGPGQAVVGASAAGLSGRPSQIFVHPALDTLQVIPQSATVSVTGSQQFAAVGKDPSGNIVAPSEISWSVSDPSRATVDQTGRVIGLQPGNVKVSATANGLVGVPSLLSVAIFVPIARMDADPLFGAPPVTVQFQGTPTADAYSTIISYAWDFGDGATGTGVTTEHTYTGTGIFVATMTVTDALGATSIARTPIVVYNPP